MPRASSYPTAVGTGSVGGKEGAAWEAETGSVGGRDGQRGRQRAALAVRRLRLSNRLGAFGRCGCSQRWHEKVEKMREQTDGSKANTLGSA